MAQTQQFQLKLAVSHHPTLKTQQLIEFLQNQSNQFLANDFPHSITQDRFITIFQSLPQGYINSQNNDFSQYVGLLLLYSSSSVQSFEHVQKNIPNKQALADLFMIIVEMDNTDKKTNAIGDQGQKMCKKFGYQFVRLTLYNSQELVTCLHRSLYQIIQNYYYPNEEQRPPKKTYQAQYVFNYGTTPTVQQQQQQQNQQNNHQISTSSNLINSPITNKKSKQKQRIIATKQQRKSLQKLMQRASQLRQSRHNQILQQQKQIDQSIENVEKVLQKINQNVNSKLKSNWYTSLNHTLYSPLQKNSISYAKIKLTQQFLNDSQQSQGQIPDISKINKKKQSKLSKTQNPGRPQKTALVNKFIAKHRKLQPILKILLTVSDSVIVQLDVYQQSQYHDLTMLAIKKLGINQTQQNYTLMWKIISQRIQQFVKELSRAVKQTQKIRLDQRSYLKSNNSNSNKNLYKSNASFSSISRLQ